MDHRWKRNEEYLIEEFERQQWNNKNKLIWVK